MTDLNYLPIRIELIDTNSLTITSNTNGFQKKSCCMRGTTNIEPCEE